MQVRLGEHIANIKIGFKYHSVSKHYDMFYNRNPANTIFLAIDKYSAHWRGGSPRMASIHPYGLNIDTDVNAFIDNG